jgi:fucose 4-O-acetylase-like acetyltransferase
LIFSAVVFGYDIDFLTFIYLKKQLRILYLSATVTDEVTHNVPPISEGPGSRLPTACLASVRADWNSASGPNCVASKAAITKEAGLVCRSVDTPFRIILLIREIIRKFHSKVPRDCAKLEKRYDSPYSVTLTYLSNVRTKSCFVTQSIAAIAADSPAKRFRPLEQRERIAWVDTARGFGIILVVVGHAIGGLVAGHLMPWTPTTRFIDDWIYTFHMPLFFFLSGLFISRSLGLRWTSFALDKLCTIAYPYFVWSTITVLIKVALGWLTNYPNTLFDLVLIPYRPIAQYWFFYVLFILLLTVSALLKLGIRPWAIFLISFLIYPGVLPFFSHGWYILRWTSAFAIYFAVGATIGWARNLATISGIPRGWLFGISVCGLLGASLGGLSELPHGVALEPILAMSGIFGTVALAVLIATSKLDAAIGFLGRHSLEIYVAHTIASACVRIVLVKICHVSALAPHLVLGILAGLYMPIALVIIFRRVGFRYGFTFPRSHTTSTPLQPHYQPSITYRAIRPENEGEKTTIHIQS